MRRECITSGFGIIVADRAHVFVGNYYMSENDEQFIHLTGASIIRRWGTTKGLGQLAKEGPTSNTVLDPMNAPVYLNKDALLFVVDTDKSLW